MLKAITFDFWETLYTDPNPWEAEDFRVRTMAAFLWAGGFPSVGLVDLAQRLEECRRMTLMEQSRGGEIVPAEQLEWVLGSLRLDPPGPLRERLLGVYGRDLKRHPLSPQPGVREVLESLSGRFRLGIISNTGRTPGVALREYLESEGLDRYFELMVFSDEAGVAKPNPAIFQKAARGFGLQPGEILHVGDDPHSDFAGSQKAGFRSLLYNSRGLRLGPEVQPVVTDLREILRPGCLSFTIPPA